MLDTDTVPQSDTWAGDPVEAWRQRAMDIWTLLFAGLSALPSLGFALFTEHLPWQRATVAGGWLLAVAAAALRRWPVWARLLLWLLHSYGVTAIGITFGSVGINLAIGLTSGPVAVTVLWGAVPGLVVAALNLSLFLGSVWAADAGWLAPAADAPVSAALYTLRILGEVVPKLLLLVWIGHSLTGAVRREAQTSSRLRDASRKLEREAAERLAAQRAALASADRERERIGRDLHDGVCQDLTSLLLRCSVLQRGLSRRGAPEAPALDGVVGEIGVVMGEVRSLSRQLVPGELDGPDLARAINALATAAGGGEVAISSEVAAPSDLSGAAGLHMLRIAQEAVHNALRHAAARRIDVTLTGGPEGVLLRVDDDGRGLPSGGAGGGLGLRTMTWRAEMAGGTLTVGARPGGGTRVECRLAGRGVATAAP